MNDNELADVLDSYGPGMPLQYEEAKAAAVRLRELSAQSVLLNSVAWAMAEALGIVGPDDETHHLERSPLDMVRELTAGEES